MLRHFDLLDTGDCGDYTYWNRTCFKLYVKPELKFEDAVQVCEDEGGKIITTGEYQSKINFVGGEYIITLRMDCMDPQGHTPIESFFSPLMNIS